MVREVLEVSNGELGGEGFREHPSRPWALEYNPLGVKSPRRFFMPKASDPIAQGRESSTHPGRRAARKALPFLLRPILHHKRQLRLRRVDQRGEFVDVLVAVVVKRDEGRDVERRRWRLRLRTPAAAIPSPARLGGVGEVVVAIDEDAGSLSGSVFFRLSMSMFGKLRLIAPFTCIRSYISLLRASRTIVPSSWLILMKSSSVTRCDWRCFAASAAILR